MPESVEVLVPLLNPNEPDAQVSALHIEEGQRVKKDEVLCTVETTKSTAEVLAEQAGYIVGLEVSPGDHIRAGARLCWVGKEPDWEPPEPPVRRDKESEETLPEGLRISQPALMLARELGLNLADLPVGPLVTEAMIQRAQTSEGGGDLSVLEQDFNPHSVIIYGGGGHGKAVIDLVRSLGTFDIIGVIDDGISKGEEVLGVPVLGSKGELGGLQEKGIRLALNAVGGVGDVHSRVEVFRRLVKAGFAFPSLIHPTAFVEPSVKLESGVQVFPHAYIGSDSEVGFGCIVNTAAVVSHDCTLSPYVNIAPGALLAGGVTIGEGVLVGMGATLNLHVAVGPNARIGNSAVIKDDVPAGQIVRAGSVWPEG